MKSIIASDIHGNLKYTLKLEELINNYNPDYIILLGDIYTGPNKQEVIDILNKYKDKICAVKGNCDREEDNDLTLFNFNREYFTIKIDNLRFLATHGNNIYKYEQEKDIDYFLVGHTHVYNCFGKYLNPGSVGNPRLNKEYTCFLLTDNNLKLIDLDTLEVLINKELEKRL